MSEYLKVRWTDEMEKDFDECNNMEADGEEKDCENCSCNGGNLDCLGLIQTMEVSNGNR